MITLEQVLKMWETDSQINNNKLDTASVDAAKMHAKYLELLSLSKLSLKKAERSQNNLLKDKWSWYNGKMSKQDMDEKGWGYDPMNGLKVLKGDMDYFYNSDADIQKSEELIIYWKTMVETLQEIIDTLRWRHTVIGNIIKWKVFEAGA